MSKHNEHEQEVDEDDVAVSIDEKDFGFLLDGQGKLKTIFGPDEMIDAPPENVQKILDIFSVESPDLIKRLGITLH